MRKFNAFRLKLHRDSSHRAQSTTATTSTLIPHPRSSTIVNTNHTTPTQPITISAPIIHSHEKVVINCKYHPNETYNEEQAAIIVNDNKEKQIVMSEESEKLSDEFNHIDDQVD
ncbi:unnamed protein product [Rotaria socialis]|uniref:Uncharacterized protein n=1 Tax=Rotaria socialis TaxID=392032 RepID=A0A817NIC6_9BILA|nr:unnamed protein product [Rotaria socialis]